MNRSKKSSTLQDFERIRHTCDITNCSASLAHNEALTVKWWTGHTSKFICDRKQPLNKKGAQLAK